MEDTENVHAISSDSISSDSFCEEEKQPGLISRVAGGAYNTTATILGGVKNVATPVIGGATWLTGTALTTSFGMVKSVGSYVLPARFKPADPKDKAD